MRSLEKGSAPLDADGQPVTFNDYRDASPYLKDRIGRYCSYCERTIPVSLAVEHKLPKRWHPWLERDWYNLILACANCNGNKGTDQAAGVVPMWPDEDDTFSVVEYHRSGAVAPRQGLSAEESRRVLKLLALVGLDKTPAESGATDHRFFDRLETWRLAEQSVIDLANADSLALRRAALNTARLSGGYSIWRRAFADDPEMTAALVNAFPGTHDHPRPA